MKQSSRPRPLSPSPSPRQSPHCRRVATRNAGIAAALLQLIIIIFAAVIIPVNAFVGPTTTTKTTRTTTQHHKHQKQHQKQQQQRQQRSAGSLRIRSYEKRAVSSWSTMVMAAVEEDASEDRSIKEVLAHVLKNVDTDAEEAADTAARKKKYRRKREKPVTEQEVDLLQRKRQEEYERIQKSEHKNVWSFESLFPEPVWDETSIQRDLFEVAERDLKLKRSVSTAAAGAAPAGGAGASKKAAAGSSAAASTSTTTPPGKKAGAVSAGGRMRPWRGEGNAEAAALRAATDSGEADVGAAAKSATSSSNNSTGREQVWNGKNRTVDFDMTRRVEGAVYGIRQTNGNHQYEYDTSLMGQGAVQFRDGVRLGNALKINADRLNFMAKKEMAHGRIEEAQELYEKALELDPRDGRAYLGLSRIAEKRRDFKLARQALRSGISNSVSLRLDGEPDYGGNPFLLQALGCLEEKAGHLAQAEALYISAARSRPSHAASWVALAQLRTRKLRQTAAAGRICYQTAERELQKANLPPSAHVYTAWAALEYKKAGDARRARELFQAALKIDPKCSAAYLQLGVMEADKEQWDAAQDCFERVLQFDKRNSRVLQAYALMETKRPDGSSRKAIELFERALKARPRDAGVLQAYALFVARLGDIDAARSLLQRGTKVGRRHAPLWQAWGVLETRYGTAQDARNIFQQGIWACSQLSGGQSGGYDCARLWQAWGVLEASEGDPAAARRCFSRALDADTRNVAAITAWTLMEEELGNERDAQLIFERALKQFPPGSEEKMSLWRTYEMMEQRLGNLQQAQNVYQRSMRESMILEDVVFKDNDQTPSSSLSGDSVLIRSSEQVEVSRWGDSSPMGGEVWMNNGSIEAKVPKSVLKKKNQANTRRKSTRDE